MAPDRRYLADGLVGVSASADDAGPQAPPFGHRDSASFWTLASPLGGLLDPEAILHFEGDQSLSFDIPCYRRSWAYLYDAGVMSFGNVYEWWPRCSGGVPPIVAAFDATIPKVTNAQVVEDTMTLCDAGGRPLLVLKHLTATGLRTASGGSRRSSTENRSLQLAQSSRGHSAHSSPSFTAACLDRPVVADLTDPIRCSASKEPYGRAQPLEDIVLKASSSRMTLSLPPSAASKLSRTPVTISSFAILNTARRSF